MVVDCGCHARLMQTAPSASLLAVGAVFISLVVVGCSAAPEPGPDPAPQGSSTPLPFVTPSFPSESKAVTAERAAEYAATVADFPFALPDGIVFPIEMPSHDRGNGVSDGAGVAYQWWSCVTLEAAWGAAESGDIADADALLHAFNEKKVAFPDYYRGWEAPRQIHWDNPNERYGGDSGLCSAWFDRLAENK